MMLEQMNQNVFVKIKQVGGENWDAMLILGPPFW